MSSPSIPSSVLDQLVEQLANALAPRIADELAARLGASAATDAGTLGTAQLVTLDELVAQLPKSKAPATWKRWLYEHLRRGEVAGAVKLGGSWFFDVEATRAWLEGASCVRPSSVP